MAPSEVWAMSLEELWKLFDVKRTDVRVGSLSEDDLAELYDLVNGNGKSNG